MTLVELRRAWAPYVLSILRIMSGLLFLQHGTAKYLGFPYVERYEKLNWMSLSGIAGLMELVGGLLIVFGLFTRPVAFLLSGEMAFAYWISHGPRNWAPLINQGELAALYCFAFLYLAFAGGGPWSADAALRKSD